MKRITLLAFVFFVAAAPFLRSAAAQTEPSPASSDIQIVLNNRVANDPGVGIIVGIIDHDKTTVYKAGSSGTSAPLDEHTLFEIGSVTKTFTATILATMVLDRTVNLSDPVAKFLPKTVHVPSRDGKQITLLNLATQHSGLPRLPKNMGSQATDPYASYSIHKMYEFLDSYKLTRDPGAIFEYSNFGTGLLGVALADRSHTSYAELLKARVLKPLGMTETAVSTTMTPALNARLAAGHNADDDAVPPWNFQAIAPAGAIRSSLNDMLKYLRCNMGAGPLAQACLFAQKPRDAFPGNHIGLVWWTGDVRRIINHGGDTAGFHAWVAISPDRGKGVVVLTNGGSSVADIAFHALDPSLPLDAAASEVHLDAATLDEYVGTYSATQPQLTYTLARNGDKLTAQLSGQPPARIYSSAKDRFFYKVVSAQIDFSRDAKGLVNTLVLRQNGESLTFVKTGMAAPSPTPEPTAAPIISLDSATLDGYAGSYLVGPGAQFVVKRDGDKLMVQLTGQAFYQVFPTAIDHFYYKVVDAQIDFERDAGGRVKDLVLHQNGQNITATKQ